MNLAKLFQFQVKFAFAVTLGIASPAIFTSQILAINQISNLDNQPVRFVPPPSNTPEPSGSDNGSTSAGTRQAGGNRPSGACLNTNKPLAALVYSNKGTSDINSEIVEGITVNEHPTFWFYVPYTSPLSAKFVLMDENGELLYSKPLTLSEKPGIVSIDISKNSTVNPLEIGKKYRWRFAIVCNSESPSADIFVDGWVQRIAASSSLTNQLATATERNQSVIYSANGIWYDAVTILGDRFFKNPTDNAIASDWLNLLKSVGLDNFANEPIVQRYHL